MSAQRKPDILPAPFDWKNPDYAAVFKKRVEALQRIRREPACVPDLKAYYRSNPAAFINDWGVTVDPRNIERNLPSFVPFLLFPRQQDWVAWVIENWKNQSPGITEKSRDMGISWLATGLSCTLCLHYEGMAIGFGSRKEEYVDKIGSPKSLFYKARTFMSNLPVEFRGGWILERDAPHLRLNFPESGSNISGEAGDNIGRGDRTGIYFVDESAYLERPELIEASLSQTTNCRQDISSVKGMNNPFAQKRWSGKLPVFIFDWRQDPRKDEAWYAKQEEELSPVVLAQEVDRNYNASVEAAIPYIWVRAAIDAHVKLGIKPTGARSGALDVADEGQDGNAFCGMHGVVVEFLEAWSGEGGDIFKTVQHAFNICDAQRYEEFKYDGDGLGAGVRGDARVINEKRAEAKRPQLKVLAFRGSEGVVNPLGEDVPGRTNEDFFANRKAQAWWALRTKFQKTYRWVVEGQPCNPDEIISLSSTLRLLDALCSEISQPTQTFNAAGKMVIDKAPDGAKSPNLADALVIRAFNLKLAPMRINPDILRRA